jgi:hypothetical protein
VVDGLTFDSKGEAKRWFDLKLSEKEGVIFDLERQVTFPLMCAGKLICKYKADFVYMKNTVKIVEDFKSKPTITPEFRLKAKLFEANYGFPITITGKL